MSSGHREGLTYQQKHASVLKRIQCITCASNKTVGVFVRTPWDLSGCQIRFLTKERTEAFYSLSFSCANCVVTSASTSYVSMT